MDNKNNTRVLMIAYHYPPSTGSSGLQRTLSFSRYLPDYGFNPVILSAHPRAYPKTASDQLSDIPEQISVHRAFALDTARHLSLRGSYVGWMALPDRWVSWYLGAVPAGLKLIRKYKPKLIWSTYPIATSHLIGLTLSRLTGIPWIADFRDPMVEIDPRTGKHHPSDKPLRNTRLWIERQTVQYAARVVFCTNGAREICSQRYPDIPASKWRIISNGYDQRIFEEAEKIKDCDGPDENTTTLLHSGILYPGSDRDPTAFFDAIATLLDDKRLSPTRLKVILRGSGFEDDYMRLIKERNLEDTIFLESPIPYREAIAEMLSADGLLLFQGYTSNPAIPAKLYEYIRAKRPIFALVDAEGDTAGLLSKIGLNNIVPIDNSVQILDGLIKFLDQIVHKQAYIPTEQQIAQYSRETKTLALSQLFQEVLND